MKILVFTVDRTYDGANFLGLAVMYKINDFFFGWTSQSRSKVSKLKEPIVEILLCAVVAPIPEFAITSRREKRLK